MNFVNLQRAVGQWTEYPSRREFEVASLLVVSRRKRKKNRIAAEKSVSEKILKVQPYLLTGVAFIVFLVTSKTSLVVPYLE